MNWAELLKIVNALLHAYTRRDEKMARDVLGHAAMLYEQLESARR